jgi:hypothetical protein
MAASLSYSHRSRNASPCLDWQRAPLYRSAVDHLSRYRYILATCLLGTLTESALALVAVRDGASLCAEDDEVHMSPVNVQGLEPQEAVAKLQAHNTALTRRVNQLHAVKEENAILRNSLKGLKEQNRTLEDELSKKAALLRASQEQHRFALPHNVAPPLMRVMR